MFDDMNNLKIHKAFHGISSPHFIMNNRPCHALIFKISGESVYSFNGKRIRLKQGEILFIPKGTCFENHCISGDNKYIIIDFSAHIGDVIPRKFNTKGYDVAFIFESMVKEFVFQDDTLRYGAMSIFYKLLSYICREDNRDYDSRQKRRLIGPALKYLETHIFDCNLKTEQLHTLCNISGTYFRKIFTACFGISPKQYITNKRLALAKNILDNGDYTYIYEVAAAVGYSDPLYFSRIFNKRYGYYPTKSN